MYRLEKAQRDDGIVTYILKDVEEFQTGLTQLFI